MRLELIHPMLVHFPIALLSTGVLVRFAALITQKRFKNSFLLPASWLILGFGVLMAWITVIFGELAADIVAPTLKNMELLHEHKLHAYRTAIGFTAGLGIDLFRGFLQQKKSWVVKQGLALIFCVLYLVSLGNLTITGAYGSRLVYEEGSAVKKPN
jgi:uncharacterized membrane protein